MNKKWYLYRNRRTNQELRFEKRKYFMWLKGYRLFAIVDFYVDKKKAKVGGN